MADARLQLLGGFLLERVDTRVELPEGTQRLLAFLAVKGPAHRCLVAGTMWPDVAEDHALACLRTGIWRLNRLAPGLVGAEGMLLSASRSLWIDSRQQEAFAIRVLRDHHEDDASVMRGLDTLWHRELLPGWYDDWVVFERERLCQLRLHALERLAVVMTERNRLDVALQLALEAVCAEPLRETAAAALMSVHLAEGNVADALRQYLLFRDRLDRELGVAPSPSLAGLLPRQLVRDAAVTTGGV